MKDNPYLIGNTPIIDPCLKCIIKEICKETCEEKILFIRKEREEKSNVRQVRIKRSKKRKLKK